MTDKEKLAAYERILAHAMPEKSGKFFICGASPIGDDGLPDRVHICPSFGADYAAIYERVNKGA